MYTGQRHKSVLINSSMYTSRVTLVFSRASHGAKAVSFFCGFFSFVCVLNYTTVIRFRGKSELVSSGSCIKRALFRLHSVIFPLRALVQVASVITLGLALILSY